MNSVEFTYIRNSANHPVGAVAVEVISQNSVKLGISKCHPKDKFVKAVARNRACGRLNSKTESFQLGGYNNSWEEQQELLNLADIYRLDGEQIDHIAKFIRGRMKRVLE